MANIAERINLVAFQEGAPRSMANRIKEAVGNGSKSVDLKVRAVGDISAEIRRLIVGLNEHGIEVNIVEGDGDIDSLDMAEAIIDRMVIRNSPKEGPVDHLTCSLTLRDEEDLEMNVNGHTLREQILSGWKTICVEELGLKSTSESKLYISTISGHTEIHKFRVRSESLVDEEFQNTLAAANVV